jgi:hypothetical protein
MNQVFKSNKWPNQSLQQQEIKPSNDVFSDVIPCENIASKSPDPSCLVYQENKSEKDNGHIMISYNHSTQGLCLQIAEELKKTRLSCLD